MPADGLLDMLPQLGVTPAVSQGGGEGHGVAHGEIVLQGVQLVAPGGQDHGLGVTQGGAGRRVGRVHGHDLAGQGAAGTEGGLILHLDLHLIGIVQGIVGGIYPVIVHDEGIPAGEAVESVGGNGLAIDGNADPNIRRPHQRLVLIRHAEGGLVPGGGALLGVGGGVVLHVDLLGGPYLAVHDQCAPGHLQYLGRDLAAAVDGCHPQVAVDGGQNRLARVSFAVGLNTLDGGIGGHDGVVLAAVDDLQGQVGVGQAELGHIDNLGAVEALQGDLCPDHAGGGAVIQQDLVALPADFSGKLADGGIYFAR